ncbi:MAG: hypothetical protein A2096_05450 [Spirochaetes bacterium GWF1_41_5]|nr:MAG: hypothetical protein A2096_05450 [Spirochaetes bacterium GWF1_41_5]
MRLTEKNMLQIIKSALIFIMIVLMTVNAEEFRADTSSMGIAGAGTASRNALTAMYNNPAGLTGKDASTQIFISLQQQDVKDYNFGIGLFNTSTETISIGFYYDAIFSRHNSHYNRYFNVSSNASHTFISKATNNFHELGLAGSHPIGKHVIAGLRLNQYYGLIHGSSKLILGLSPGITVFFRDFSAGIVMNDLLTAFHNNRPASYKFGLAYKIALIMINTDLNFVDVKQPYGQDMLKPAIGLQVTFKDSYGLKAGFTTTYYMSDKALYNNILTLGTDFYAKIMDVYITYKYDFNVKERIIALALHFR